VPHTFAIVVHDTEDELSFGTSLLSCLPVQAHGLGMILLRTLAIVVHYTEVELSFGISLLGCLPVQARSLGVCIPAEQVKVKSLVLFRRRWARRPF